jgi:uncharacterized protein
LSQPAGGRNPIANAIAAIVMASRRFRGAVSTALNQPAGGRTPIANAVAAIVMASRRFRGAVLIIAAIVTAVSAYYAGAHFQINTRTRNFISEKLPWRQDMIAMDKAFPQEADQIVIVIDGKTAELTEAAAQHLSEKLRSSPGLFRSVERQDGGRFFNRNALLFVPIEETRRTAEELIKAKPLLRALASDPSLRGIADTFSFMSRAVSEKTGTLAGFEKPIFALAATFDDVLSGRPAFFSWRSLLTGEAPNARELRQIVLVKPILDYKALQPGNIPDTFIQETAKDLGLTPDRGVTVRLTGSVPLADEEYSALKEGLGVNNAIAALIVVVILWLALHSPRLVLAVAASVVTGLLATAAAGLAMAGSFNLLSLSFGVLFVGIGTDFGIQLSVRYRAERHQQPEQGEALQRAAGRAGRPLALAAAATAVGFYCFLPTNYTGLGELGLIAGTGMIIAFLTTITVLPAAISFLGSPTEENPVGFKFLAPVGRFTAKHRYAIIAWTLIVALGASFLLTKLQFDFNPIDLSPANAEAVRTMRDLTRNPQTDPDTINILSPSLADAQSLADRLRQLPEVAEVVTAQSFIPADQRPKLAITHRLAAALKPALYRVRHSPAPTDAEDAAAMERAAQILVGAAGHDAGKAADEARHLAEDLQKLAAAPPQQREIARGALVPSLDTSLALSRESLHPRKVTLASLPPELKRGWLTPDGRARISVAPNGNTNDAASLNRFTTAVLKIAPNATGQPVISQKSGETVVRAFIEAGAWAVLAICVLLLIVLRRISDMLLTIIPLLLAGLVTLEIAAIVPIKLNFANIIALPLLLGLGVAFKIYFVMAWRAGAANLLESSLTRAVFFSALTSATAFGSLWFSRYPGMASMGELLVIALGCTMAAAVFFQPILMGPPRKISGEEAI